MTNSNMADVSTGRVATTVRAHTFVPALVLLAAGLAVTFTQTLHEVLSFNEWIVAAFGVLYGAACLAAPALGASRTVGTLIMGVASLGVGVAAPFMSSTRGLAMLLLVWAALAAITEIWRWANTRERDALAVGVFAALLAVILAFAARELPAVMGFFAGYCIIVGVYLGIAAFDRPAVASEPEV